MAEHKFLDTLWSDVAAEAGEVGGTSLVLVPQGTTASQRIGREITVRRIQAKAILQLNDNDTISTTTYKVALVLDTQANGANPSWSDVYVTGNSETLPNVNNEQRFYIIKEFFGTLNATAFDSLNNVWALQQKSLEFDINVEIPIQYSGTAGLITEVQSNNLLWMIQSQGGALEIFLYQRIRYTD